MSISKYLKLLFKQIINKNNIILVILYIILSSIIIFCLSYFNGIQSLWDKWLNNSYDFDLAYVLFDNNTITQKELLQKLQNDPNVLDSFLYDEFLGSAIIDDFKSSIMSGEIKMIGTINGNKKILYGRDFKEDGSMEMICPSNFFPDPVYVNQRYNFNNTVDLKNYIDKPLNIKYLGEYEIPIKIVGVFDATYDLSDPNICYVSHLNLKNLNDKYQANLDYERMPIYIQLNNNTNINSVKNIEGVLDAVLVKQIKEDTINDVIRICGIAVILATIMVFFLSYFIYKRKLINQYKYIGLMKIVGYENYIIKSLFYTETLLISIISIVLGYLINIIVSSKFLELFLYSDPQLALMNISISKTTVAIAFIFVLTIFSLAVKIVLKNINKMEIKDIIYD